MGVCVLCVSLHCVQVFNWYHMKRAIPASLVRTHTTLSCVSLFPCLNTRTSVHALTLGVLSYALHTHTHSTLRHCVPAQGAMTSKTLTYVSYGLIPPSLTHTGIGHALCLLLSLLHTSALTYLSHGLRPHWNGEIHVHTLYRISSSM